MFLMKLRYNLLFTLYFVFWFLLGVYFLFTAINGAISNSFRKDLKETSPRTIADYHDYFESKKPLVKMILIDKKTRAAGKSFVKKNTYPVAMFSFETSLNGKTARVWYSSDSFVRQLNNHVGKILLFVVFWLILGAVGFYVILKKAFFLPLEAAMSGTSNCRDNFTGLFGGLVKKMDTYKEQRNLAEVHTSMLLQAAKTVSSYIDLNRTLSQILDMVVEKFPKTSCAITMLDEDGYLRVKNSRGLSNDFVKAVKLKRCEGFVGECVETRKIIVIQDTDIDKKAETEHLEKIENIKSFVHIPIVVENRAIGTFNINSSQKDYFTHEIVNIVATLCEYLSIAIANARLYEKIKDFNRRLEAEVSYTTSELLKTNTKLVEKIRELKAISDIFNIVSKNPDINKGIAEVFDRVREILNVDVGAFFSYNSRSKILTRRMQFFGYRKITFDDELSAFSVDVKNLEVVRDVVALKEPKMDNSPHPPNWSFLPKEVYVQSLIVFPVSHSDDVLGVMVLANKLGGKFESDDMDFVSLVCSFIAEYIGKQKLLKK